MTDQPRGKARQPRPHHKPETRKPNRPPRHGRPRSARQGADRKKPHARSAHAADPRALAHSALSRLRDGDLIAPAIAETLRFAGADPNLAPRIAPMVEDAVRFARLFDLLLSHVSSRAPETLDRQVRAAIHLFLAWYLLDSPRAVYAHGQAAVDLLPRSHAGRGFVNACVRRLGEMFRVETLPPEDYRGMAERFETPAFPRNRARLGGGRWVCAELPFLPDFETHPAEALAAACGLPEEFAKRLLEQHGPQSAAMVCLAAVEKPRIWLRANRLRISPEDLIAAYDREGVALERLGDALALPAEAGNPAGHSAFVAGAAYIQDWSAQQAAPALEPKPGEMLLDLCAAPGGKAGHLAELSRDEAKILACDISQEKADRIAENLVRMGYRSVATVVADAAKVHFPGRFDGVLVDAPCTNSGVLGRRVEARHRLGPDALKPLNEIQLGILRNGAKHLKPGGRLVYSVCSVLMEEGIDLVRRFLMEKDDGAKREDLGWEMELERILLPVPGWHDGAYLCRLRAPEP